MSKKAVIPQQSEAAMYNLVSKDAARRLRSYPSRVARLIEGKSVAQAKTIMTAELRKALDGLGDGPMIEIRNPHSAGAI